MQSPVFSNLPAVYSEKPTALQINQEDSKRLTPWRLEADHIVAYHYHHTVEIGYCFEGRGIHYSSTGEFPFQAGDALFMIPGVPHYTVSAAQTVTKWMFLYFELDDFLGAGSFSFQGEERGKNSWNPSLSLYEIISCRQYPELCGLILSIVRQYQTFLPGRSELLRLLCTELLLLLGREQGDLPPRRIRQEVEYGRLEPAVNYIHAAIDRGRIPEPGELAEMCYMSPSYFRSIFRKTMGTSLHDYMIRLAVRRTQKLLLSSDKSILDICAEAGFRSISSLNRNFQIYCGMSPQAYRREHQYLY